MHLFYSANGVKVSVSDRALSDTVTRLERAPRSDRGAIPFLLPPLCPQHFFRGAYPPQSPLPPSRFLSVLLSLTCSFSPYLI